MYALGNVQMYANKMHFKISLFAFAAVIIHVHGGWARSWDIRGGGDEGGREGWEGGKRLGWGRWEGERGGFDEYARPKYEFEYGVRDGKTGDNKEQSEVRRDDVVKGEYSFLEPDGTKRTVLYEADDKNGFNAKVIRKGPAIHPEVYARSEERGYGIGQGGLGYKKW